ncbi:hypothetical protein DMUE_1086 [Dictyocoela muelleri]|nr:hypothetical protein DMUE_1086 [Dictyocoela muelleri]
MKTKTTKSYISIFNFIKSKICQEPKYMIIDFEMAVFNAVRQILPDIIINGCNFHFNQLIVKYLINNKLIDIYRTNENFKNFVKYLLLLAFVPLKSMEMNMKKLKQLKVPIFILKIFWSILIVIL